MKDSHDQRIDSGLQHFVSPCCGGELSNQGSTLVCKSCDKIYKLRDGLFEFAVESSDHGELSTQEMEKFLDQARDKGWRTALKELDHTQNSRVEQLISNPLRANSIQPISKIGGRVLDFGCGYGAVSMSLADCFEEVVSLDGSKERVSFLNIMKKQERKNNITPVCHMNVLELPFKDNYFDAITLIGVLEYLPQTVKDCDPGEAHLKCLRSFLRVLKPGGQLLIHTKNRYGWQYLRGGKDHSGLPFAPALPRKVADILLRATGRGPYRIINYSKSGYSRLLLNAGFKEVKFWWPYPGYQMPMDFVDLSISLKDDLEALKELGVNSKKIAMYKALASMGLLNQLVPNFTILARK